MVGESKDAPWTWTEEDVEMIVASKEAEGWHLEYKRSGVLKGKNQ